jgi:dCTP diphosphatase
VRGAVGRQLLDWNQFDDPKSLILALVGEVGELAELFQWLSDQAAAAAGRDPLRTRAAEEQKLADAARRFPAAEHAGVAPYKAT